MNQNWSLKQEGIKMIRRTVLTILFLAGCVFLPVKSGAIETIDDKILNDFIWAVAAEKQDVWFGCYKGIIRHQKGKNSWEIYNAKDGLADDNVTGILPENGQVWAATLNGLSCFDGNNWSKIEATQGQLVYALAANKDYVYAGTCGAGLFCYDKKNQTWKQITTKDGLVSNYIFSLAADDEEIWVGTDKGASRFNLKKSLWQTYTEKDGLANNVVGAIAVDGEYVWFGTNIGVSRFGRKTNQWLTWSVYEPLEGRKVSGEILRENISGRIAAKAILVKDGCVYVAATGGLYVYDKKQNEWSMAKIPGGGHKIALACDGDELWYANSHGWGAGGGVKKIKFGDIDREKSGAAGKTEKTVETGVETNAYGLVCITPGRIKCLERKVKTGWNILLYRGQEAEVGFDIEKNTGADLLFAFYGVNGDHFEPSFVETPIVEMEINGEIIIREALPFLSENELPGKADWRTFYLVVPAKYLRKDNVLKIRNHGDDWIIFGTIAYGKAKPETIAAINKNSGALWQAPRELKPKPLFQPEVPLLGVKLDRSFYTDEKEALLEVKAGKQGSGTALAKIRRHQYFARGSAPGEEDVLVKQPLSDSAAVLSLPIEKLAEADYEVKVTIQDAHETEIAARSVVLRKLPKKGNEVKTTGDGRLIVDGKPFFTVGLYWPWTHSFPWLKKCGFNTVVTELGTSWLGTGSNVLETARANNLKVIAYPIHEDSFMVAGDGKAGWQNRIPQGTSARRADYTAHAKPVREYCDHPGLLCWYVFDEPDGYQNNYISYLAYASPEAIAKHSNFIKFLDPYHPVMITLCVGVTYPRMALAYASACDIISQDKYFEDRELDKEEDIEKQFPTIALHAKYLAEAARLAGGKPSWNIVQADFFYPNTRMLTIDEIRAETYLSITKGVNGILYFSYTDPKTTVLQFGDFLHELEAIAPILAGPVSGEEMKVKNNSVDLGIEAIHAIVKEHEGKKYLIAVNGSCEIQKPQFVFSGGKKAKVLFEERTVEIKNGVLEDRFKPFTRHIYEITN